MFFKTYPCLKMVNTTPNKRDPHYSFHDELRSKQMLSNLYLTKRLINILCGIKLDLFQPSQVKLDSVWHKILAISIWQRVWQIMFWQTLAICFLGVLFPLDIWCVRGRLFWSCWSRHREINIVCSSPATRICGLDGNYSSSRTFQEDIPGRPSPLHWWGR